MKPLTIVTPHISEPLFEKTLLPLTRSALVERVVIVSRESVHFEKERCQVLVTGPLFSHKTLGLIIGEIQTKYLLLLPGTQPISIEPGALERLTDAAGSMNAGMVYSDFYDQNEDGKKLRPLNEYQPGSVRDDFDFGGMILFSIPAIRKTLKKYGLVPGVTFAGLYDLRLKVSIDHPIYHLKEPLYTLNTRGESSSGEEIFAYVNPKNRAAQKELEIVFTEYLKKIGAYLSPQHLRDVKQKPESSLVEASVIIPVRNRKETITDAVRSALSQETDFPFNVIVVDNHSTDGTTAVLSGLARQDTDLKHIVPNRTDLGIGGCWNEAIHSEACGSYAVQLDSDDLYSSSHTLQKMVDKFRQGNYGMVIGSYTLVDTGLKKIPPGLIDHREWTDENGHNNALRINGLGAPRAFVTSLMRKFGFLNVSYGEDYAAGLRICREYRTGRIYESLYLCRRWPGNTDASLTIEEANRNDAFKDRIRTEEIAARQKIAEGIEHPSFVPPCGTTEDR
jgi:hypothetical protein